MDLTGKHYRRDGIRRIRRLRIGSRFAAEDADAAKKKAARMQKP
jgi:hypothetical protein